MIKEKLSKIQGLKKKNNQQKNSLEFYLVFWNFQNSILHLHRWNIHFSFWYVFKYFQVDQGDLNYQVESQFK